MDLASERNGTAKSKRERMSSMTSPPNMVVEYYRQFGVDEKTIKRMYHCQCLEVYASKPNSASPVMARNVRSR
ncbi:hypothetical protein [Desulfofundulus thermocisternus]|uniref:hypothetical protein n=1 Tax=Desulfofundulus thermocisternus TaxID=42471 RepID=UPI0012FEC85B|nr:hypothetical protein [Desulfofundulus thermocisternus]